VVGKADLGAIAVQTQGDLEAALALNRRADGWSVPVVPVSGTRAQGIAPLMRAIAEHARHLATDGRLQARRETQARSWVAEAVRSELGRRGLERAERGGRLEPAIGQAPFGTLSSLIAALLERPAGA
jgi:LAO/AO transport system kinase